MTDPKAAHKLWLEGAEYGWQSSGEGWNAEIAEARPDRKPDFEKESPYRVSQSETDTASD